MKRTAAIILLIGICFTNIAAAKYVPDWVLEDEHKQRDMAVHPDNFNAMCLEYAESKISKETLQSAIYWKIKTIRERFVAAGFLLNEEVQKTNIALLESWEAECRVIDRAVEDINNSKLDEKKFRDDIKEMAIGSIINRYGYLQEIDKAKRSLGKAMNETRNKNNGEKQ